MIEVRELLIKAIIVQSGGTKPASGSSASNNSVSGNEDIIKACVDKVIEILKEKNER
jgi:uncharacterized protein DUF5908